MPWYTVQVLFEIEVQARDEMEAAGEVTFFAHKFIVGQEGYDGTRVRGLIELGEIERDDVDDLPLQS
jgi:hypothetical protein